MRAHHGITTVALAALLAGCGEREPAETRPGQADVYERIEAHTDCADLRREIDLYVGNAERAPAGDPRRVPPMAYAQAAHDRMAELGCDDQP